MNSTDPADAPAPSPPAPPPSGYIVRHGATRMLAGGPEGTITALPAEGTVLNQGDTLQLDIDNRFYDADQSAFNIVGEIPGTDKADEIVMLGAHFDSWHSGTGATDNAAGSAVMLEALRILKQSGLPLRRTVHEVTGYPVAIEDRFGNLRAWAGPHCPDPYPKDPPARREQMLRRAIREVYPG